MHSALLGIVGEFENTDLRIDLRNDAAECRRSHRLNKSLNSRAIVSRVAAVIRTMRCNYPDLSPKPAIGTDIEPWHNSRSSAH